MLKNLVVCEVLCIAATISGCDSGVPEDPVARSVGERSAAPTPPATGINPCTGWAGGLFGAVATYTQDIGTVSFHGGTWTVPVPTHAGRSIADVSFTVEAPTGHIGDPTSVRVGVYSNGNALAFTSLSPSGIGNKVSGGIHFAPARVVAPGEVLALEFAPLDATGAAYASSDTKIDAVAVAAPAISRPKSPALAYTDGSWSGTSIVTDRNGVSMVAVTSLTNGVARVELPHEDGERIIGLSVLVAGNGVAGANFVVERFNIGLPGGLSRLGIPVVDNGRANVWSSLSVSLTPTVLLADDVLYLNLSDSTGTSGYSVGGVIPQYDRP